VEARALGEPKRGRIFNGDDYLDTAETERGEAPFGEQPQCCCCDTASARLFEDAAPQLADLAFADDDHRLAQIQVVVAVGDDEVEHLAGGAAAFEELRHLHRVACRKRLNPALRRRVGERCGTLEVIPLKRTQRERSADKRRVRKGDRDVDGKDRSDESLSEIGDATSAGDRKRGTLPATRMSSHRQKEGRTMMRRRPLRRAAVIGGVAAAAHHAGTKSAQAQAAEQSQSQPIAAPQPQPQPPAAPAAGTGSDDMVSQLESLKKLLDDGVLTQAEFDAQKQKILASS
jgi:Short C-terminal domain